MLGIRMEVLLPCLSVFAAGIVRLSATISMSAAGQGQGVIEMCEREVEVLI